MLDLHQTDDVARTKIYFSSTSSLSTYLDPKNLSTKKQPFSSINKQKYSHNLSVILPEELWTLVEAQLQSNVALGRPQYARVHMKLEEILASEFLDTYVQQGNIMMLSEGRPLVDNRFQLYEGTLRLELDKQTYERCGLQGMPIEDGGTKHQKQRWIVEINLRFEGMKRPGQKRFAKLIWACKNVLNQSLTWLFYNFNAPYSEALTDKKEVISEHAPWVYTMKPIVTKLRDVAGPRLPASSTSSIQADDDALSLLEYIHMLEIHSPRVEENDHTDPHLARYEVPDLGEGIVPLRLIEARWTGFIPPNFPRDLFVIIRSQLLRQKLAQSAVEEVDMINNVDRGKRARWFSMSARGFGGKTSWTTMQFANQNTFVWEVER